MAISFVWDAAFEAAPPNTIGRSLIDDNIRLISRGLRERFEAEHNFGFNTPSDDGSHRPGLTTVMLKGSAAARDALADPQEGAIYLVEDAGVLTLWIYTSSAWTEVGGADHQALSGLTDNDHSIHVLKDGGVMSGNLNLNGSQLKTASASGHKDSGLVLHRHNSLGHPSLGSMNAIKDDNIPIGKTKIGQSSSTVNIANGAYALVSCSRYTFFPQIYVLGSYSSNINLIGGVNATRGFGVANKSGSSVNVRFREEHLE